MTNINAVQCKSRTLQFLLCSALLIPLNIQASDVIRTRPLQNRVFDSEVAAVEAMKDHCLAESSHEDAEHMGAILQTNDGRFLVTHGQAKPGQTTVTFAILRPPTAKVVALWHTHGAPGRRTERFSIQDSDTVREIGLPFYLIAPSGQISLLVGTKKGIPNVQLTSEGAHRLKAIRKYPGLALYRVEQKGSET